MGQGDRAIASGQTDGQANKAESIVDEVSSTFSGIFRRSRQKVEEQLKGVDTQAVEETVRGVGRTLGRQAQAEVDGIQQDVKKAREGDPSALVKRGIGLAGKYGTFGSGGVALDVARRFGLGDTVDGIIQRGAEEITKVDGRGFAAKCEEIFSTVDKNKDGFMELSEIEEAKKDKVFWAQYAFTLRYLGDNYDRLSNLSNDEWFKENNGIHRGDISALRNAVDNGTGFGAGLSHAFESAKGNALPSLAWGSLAYGGSRFFNYARSGRTGLIAGAAYLVGSTGYDTVDYLFSRKGNLNQTLKDLG